MEEEFMKKVLKLSTFALILSDAYMDKRKEIY